TGYLANADIPWPAASPAQLVIDFNNGQGPGTAPFTNDSPQTFTTQYPNVGTYTVRVGAQMGRFQKPNDWWCVYTCCAQAEATIQITRKHRRTRTPLGAAWPEEERQEQGRGGEPVGSPSPKSQGQTAKSQEERGGVCQAATTLPDWNHCTSVKAM